MSIRIAGKIYSSMPAAARIAVANLTDDGVVFGVDGAVVFVESGEVFVDPAWGLSA